MPGDALRIVDGELHEETGAGRVMKTRNAAVNLRLVNASICSRY